MKARTDVNTITVEIDATAMGKALAPLIEELEALRSLQCPTELLERDIDSLLAELRDEISVKALPAAAGTPQLVMRLALRSTVGIERCTAAARALRLQFGGHAGLPVGEGNGSNSTRGAKP